MFVPPEIVNVSFNKSTPSSVPESAAKFNVVEIVAVPAAVVVFCEATCSSGAEYHCLGRN